MPLAHLYWISSEFPLTLIYPTLLVYLYRHFSCISTDTSRVPSLLVCLVYRQDSSDTSRVSLPSRFIRHCSCISTAKIYPTLLVYLYRQDLSDTARVSRLPSRFLQKFSEIFVTLVNVEVLVLKGNSFCDFQMFSFHVTFSLICPQQNAGKNNYRRIAFLGKL